MKKTIYVISHGNVLRKVGRTLLLEKGGRKVFQLPCQDVERVLIYGRTEVTAQTVSTLLEMEIPLFYLRKSGRLKGKILPPMGKQVVLREHQYRRFGDPAFALDLAKRLIDTKMGNMCTMVRYMKRSARGTAQLCAPIEELRKRLRDCNSREEIMGTEGAAARHYFQIYGSEFPPPFQFKLRSRPAEDPANALLNLGYMTLLHELEAHLESHHFDPCFGVLHAIQDGRPSLALDLMEEFRQPLIDLFVMKIVNLGQMKKDHFQKTEEGLQITDEGFKTFFGLYEETMGNEDGDNPGLKKE